MQCNDTNNKSKNQVPEWDERILLSNLIITTSVFTI